MADYKNLKASDGTGNAVLATITNNRAVSGTILEVTSVENWPNEFIVMTGTLGANGCIEAASATEMKAHLTGTDIEIDSFEPGYTDVGNTSGQVAIIKMTTGWADNIVELARVSHNDDGTLKDGSVTSTKIDFGGAGSGIWWEEISRVTVSSGTVLDTGTIPARKYLKLMLVDTGAGANGTDAVFNSDTGANYAYARTLNGSVFLNNTSRNSLEIMGNLSGMQFATVEIINIAAIEKVLHCTWISGPQAGTRNSAAQVPSHSEYSGKWVNTSKQITRIVCTRRSGSFAAGSELVVLGHD